jgi:tripartite-type tricarboxylate transporter receptor subunit TctC
VRSAPEIPTVGESGIPDFDFPLWGGLFAPAKTPAPIISLLARELNNAQDRPEIQARIAGQHSELMKLGPEQFAKFLAADAARYRTVIKESGIDLR